jgi:hypothetical protein
VRGEGARLDMRTSGKRIGHKACAQGHQGSGVDTVGRSEGTARRASRVGAAVGVLSHRSDKVQSGEAQTGRERGRVREGRERGRGRCARTGEGTARRASRVGAAVGVLSHRSDKVQSGEAQTGRERGRGRRAQTRTDRPQHRGWQRQGQRRGAGDEP